MSRFNNLNNLNTLNYSPSRYNDVIYRTEASASLDLNFARNKSLIDSISGNNLVTFTRTSSGTYVGDDGLIKKATTNLLLQSEDFSTTWTKGTNTTITTNYGEAPNGTMTANRVQMISGAGTFVTQSVNVVSGVTYSLSVYARATSGTSKIALQEGGANIQVWTIGTTWQRLSVQFTAISTGATTVGFDNDDTASDFLLWGAQLEQSSTVGEYVPTTTTINSAPRFDHDPVTKESLGLLVEESRTNLTLQSEDFGTTWTTINLLAFGSGSTLNAIASPDGATTADLITENTATGQHNINQAVTTIGQKTFSVFAKQGPGSRLLRLVDFNATDGAQGETYFNLSTGTVVSGTGAIQAFPDGWYRCSITTTTTVTSTYYISIASSNGVFSYTGDGTSGLYIWGAQLEEGAFPTSYIPTEGSTVTRSADVASITGANFSSWIDLNDGTFFSDSKIIAPSVQTQAVWSLTGGTYITSLRQPQGATNQFRAQIGNVFTPTPGTGNLLSDGTTKACVAYSGTAGRLQVGSSSNDVTSAGVLDATDLHIGSLAGGTPLNGTIRRLTYFPTRLSNTTLENITK